MLQRMSSRALPRGFWDIKDWNDFVWIFMNQGGGMFVERAWSCVVMACTSHKHGPATVKIFDDMSDVESWRTTVQH